MMSSDKRTKGNDQGAKFALLTVSDSCAFLRDKSDVSGSVLKSCALSFHYRHSISRIIQQKIVADEVHDIKRFLVDHSTGEGAADIVITTGGTGFSERDVTPEATKQMLEKDAPGIVHLLMSASLKVTNMAALSRLSAGITNRTLIVNFPGSPKAVKECFQTLKPVLPHALDVLRNNRQSIAKCHEKQQVSLCPSGHQKQEMEETGKEIQESSCHRMRKSPWPLIPVDEAFLILRRELESFEITQLSVPVENSVGFVLWEDVWAPENHPTFPASVKDGYAVIASGGKGVKRVIGGLTAGGSTSKSLAEDTCIRISTGAALPSGADCVVQIEDTKLVERDETSGEELRIELLTEPRLGQDIRPVGCDVEKGSILLRQGALLGPVEIGLLSSMGILSVKVYGKPTVALLSTGNEVVSSSLQNLPFGKIRDSNKIMLKELLKLPGFQTNDLGTSTDDMKSLTDALCRGFNSADVIVTTGGVSMGEKDFIKDVLQQNLGFDIKFGRVFMKPGKPTTFAVGRINGKQKVFFGLPGNPVSAWVTANIFVLPSLKMISKHPQPFPLVVKSSLAHDIRLDERPEFHRGKLTNWKGEAKVFSSSVATSTGADQRSSKLLSACAANVLLFLEPKTEGKTHVETGEAVDTWIL